jgi:hypothetical protein
MGERPTFKPAPKIQGAQMRLTPKPLITAGLAISMTCLSGCFLGSDNAGPSAGQVKSSDSVTAGATSNLEKNVTRMSNLDQFQYGKEDLSDLKASHAEFEEALLLNPGNSKAQVGMALTGVLLAAQSTRLSGVINQSLDAKSPFDTRVVDNAPDMRVAVLQKVAAAARFPEFHEVQDAIADTLLPALEDAVNRLQAAYNDPAFTMTLNIEDKPRELDHAEAGILLAGFHAIHGLLTLWLSYDIDIDDNGSYDYLTALDSVGDVENFSQLTAEQRTSFNQLAKLLGPTSPFLAVKPAWKSKLAGVDDEIKLALGIVKESVNSIRTETDPQADDLIHLCRVGEMEECLESGQLDQATAVLDSAIKYMNHPYELAVPGTDTIIKVDFAAYFRVQDYKKMLPHYGFYDANLWSDEKPVLFFTDASGKVTGNIKDLIQIAKDADSLGTPAANVIAQIRKVIHLQDPTFQGFLPGATEDGVWNLVRILAEQDQNQGGQVVYNPGFPKRSAVATMNPHFALSLLGHR